MSINHADAPEKRYVWLHRAIEQGNGTDNIWAELSRVCYRLGNITEAVRGARNIQEPDHRRRAEMYLVQRGVLDHPSDVQPAQTHNEKLNRTLFVEEVADSFGYLFLEHMPFTVMAATLVFPLVLGLGGFLTSGTDAWVFPAIALIPVLMAVGLIGAMARQILLEASHGLGEAPRIPELTRLVRNAGRFLRDAVLVLLVFVGPGALAWRLGLPAYYALPILAVGMVLVPMALALCQVRNDWRVIAPKTLFPAVRGCGPSYLWFAAVAGTLFAPAITAAMLTTNTDLYLRLSFVGPLAIAPVFVSARLIGRILHLNRRSLGTLIVDRTNTILDEIPKETRVRRCKSNRPTARRQSAGRRPTPTKSLRQSAAQERRQTQPRRPRQSLGRMNTPSHPETQEERRTAAPRQKTTRQKTNRQVAKAPEPADIDEIVGEATPDLVNLPGARVLRGEERESAGAASARRS